MPYSLEEAKLKSDFYRNQLDSDLIEFENNLAIFMSFGLLVTSIIGDFILIDI